jgi:hypothetical protein
MDIISLQLKFAPDFLSDFKTASADSTLLYEKNYLGDFLKP